MVARVEGDVERQRRFVANASHELRTPLAVSGALIEVAQADPDPHVAALLTGRTSPRTRSCTTCPNTGGQGSRPRR
ncbi:histidine kinase dimerization/phospho-acceptor domain-containing protein [Tessaracoccus flavescens]